MAFRFNKRLSWQVDSASDVQSDVVKQSKTAKFLLAGLAAGLGYLTLMTRVPFRWGGEGRAVAEFLIFPDTLCVCVGSFSAVFHHFHLLFEKDSICIPKKEFKYVQIDKKIKQTMDESTIPITYGCVWLSKGFLSVLHSSSITAS